MFVVFAYCRVAVKVPCLQSGWGGRPGESAGWSKLLE